MRSAYLIICLFICCAPAHAQYNDSVYYYAGAIATGNFNETNNSLTTLFNNTAKFGIRRKDVSLNSTNTWVYGTQQKNLTNNDFVSTLDFNLYKLAKHAYYWGLADYTSSYSLKINNQAQVGVGLAYNIIDKKSLNLNISDGIVFETSDIYLPDSTCDIYHTFRNSLRVMFRVDTGIVVFSGSSYYQNSFSLKTDYIVKVNLALGVKIKKWFILSVAYNYNRFNRTKSENSLFTYGLTLEKYF